MTVSEESPSAACCCPYKKGIPTAVTAAPPTVWSCCSFSVRTGVHDITSNWTIVNKVDK